MQQSSVVITIDKLRLRCIIGVLPHEREQRQEVVVTVRITLAGTQAIQSDELTDTVDYAELADQITHFVENSSFKLLERLAAGILELVLALPKVQRAEVRVEKPNTFALRFADTVSVELAKEKYV